MDTQQYKAIIEALIFISDKPLVVEQIKEVLEELDLATIKSILLELKQDYENNQGGLRIVEVAGGFQMITSPELANYLKKYYQKRQSEKLTGPSLETLAIIAYRQPVTRLEIESIRGVNIDGVLKNLMEKNLVRSVGRKEAPGRPFVYGTTRQFLEYFGLKSLEDLPKMEDFANLIVAQSQENTDGSTESQAPEENQPASQEENQPSGEQNLSTQ